MNVRSRRFIACLFGGGALRLVNAGLVRRYTVARQVSDRGQGVFCPLILVLTLTRMSRVVWAAVGNSGPLCSILLITVC